jgi:hypothetical protein
MFAVPFDISNVSPATGTPAGDQSFAEKTLFPPPPIQVRVVIAASDLM